MVKEKIGLEEAMVLTPRDRIYSTIVQNAGLHFREIQRRTGIATGALQYHIDYLKKKNLIREEKQGKFSHFYATQTGSVDSGLMNLMRQESVRRIVLFLMDKRRATLPVISKNVSLSLSTTSFHMQKLLLNKVVLQKELKGKTYFFLIDKERVLTLLVQHRASFLDSLVDNFIDAWEQELKP
jgi:predicted transcriptional regulator